MSLDNVDNISPLIEAVGILSDEIKELTAKKKAIEEQLRPLLVDKGPTTAGAYTVSVTMQPGRKTLDKKAVAAASIDLEPFMKVGAPFTLMKIIHNADG